MHPGALYDLPHALVTDAVAFVTDAIASLYTWQFPHSQIKPEVLDSEIWPRRKASARPLSFL